MFLDFKYLLNSLVSQNPFTIRIAMIFVSDGETNFDNFPSNDSVHKILMTFLLHKINKPKRNCFS